MNNRTIKFRIYDNDKKGFHYLDGIWNMPDPCYDGEIQQFTGLYDKNEKEIYEGDVIETSNKIIFTVEIPNIFYKMANGAWSEYYFEVIGNAFQNPDLLVKKSKK